MLAALPLQPQSVLDLGLKRLKLAGDGTDEWEAMLHSLEWLNNKSGNMANVEQKRFMGKENSAEI